MEERVLIVGGGPTGLTMGIELSRQGVAFRMVEKKGEPSKWSQALVVQARTLEQLERYGIADVAVEKGRKLRHAEIVSEGRAVVSMGLDRIPGRYPFALFLPQSETERILREHLERLGGRVERGVEVESFVNGEEGVEVRFRGGEVERYRWVVGCDGAHSVVRHGLGVGFEGKEVEVSFLLGDLELEGDVPGDEIRVYLHRGEAVFLGRLEEKVWRVILVEHGREWTEGKLEDFQPAMDRVVGKKIRVVGAKWISPYRVNERKAGRYRVGSAFLAGDACHIHSPVGGQGMNTGMQDAANLGWKLGAVIRDGAPEELLDTYEKERSAVGDDLLRMTSRGLSMVTTTNVLLEGIRDAAARVVTSLPWVQDLMMGFISETGIHYEESEVVVECGGTGVVRAGERMPNPDFKGRRLLDDLRTGRHLGFVRGGMPLGLRMDVLDVGEEVIGGEGGVMIVRPDGYVGFRGTVENGEEMERYGRVVGLI